MSDEQDDNNGMVGWILGIAVTLAIAVAVLTGVLAGNQSGKGADPKLAAPAISPAALPASAPNAAAASGVTPATTATTAATSATPTLPTAIKLYFESNSFATPVDAPRMLADLVKYANSSPNTKLSISGFHDKTGDAAKNQELAKNRAKVVKDMLISAGVPEDRIMMQKPVETTGGGDDKEARRVEVNVAQ